MRRFLFPIALFLPLLTLDAQLIRGRVVDADANPVAGALVQVVLADRSPLDFAEQQDERHSVPTSEDGRYEITAPAFEEVARAAIAVTVPAHATVQSAPFHACIGELRIDVALPQFETVTVRVADRAGKPLPKARVAFAPAETRALHGPERLLRRDPEALLLPQFESLMTRTDYTGQAVLHLVPGTWDFAVAAGGFQATTIAERTIKQATTIAVALEPAVAIRGRVHRQGTGVEDVEVSLMEGTRRSRNQERIVTDANGAFEVPGLAAGQYRLRFEKREEMVDRTVDAKAPSTVDVALPPAGQLRMHIVDAGTRKPVREFAYTIEPAVAPETAETVDRHYGVNTRDGILKMTLSAGAYRFGVTAIGYRRTPVEVQISDREPAEVTVELDRGAIFTGRVSDEQDAPVAAAAVTIERAKPSEWRIPPGEARTDEHGSFTVSGVDTGSVKVIVRKEGFVPFEKTVEAETGTTDVEVRLKRGLMIEGLVQRGGKPVAGAEVRAATSGLGGMEQPAITDARGKFALRGLIAARYSVTASHGSDNTRVDNVDPTRMRELVLSLDPQPTGVLYGTVSGVPATLGAKITRRVVIAQREGHAAEGMIDDAGNYRIEDAPTGTVYVRAQLESTSGGRSSVGKRIDVIAGQELRIDLEISAYPVRGHVMHDGKPVADVQIFFGSESGGYGSATSRADGAYELALPAAGIYRMDVMTNLVTNGNLQMVREVRGGDTIDIELREQAVEGTVVDAATRQPLEGIRVTLVADAMGQSFAGEMVTDASGRFRIVTSGSGSHQIVAWGSGYVHRVQPLQLSGTGRPEVAFELRKADPLRVRVVDAGTGTPLRGQVIAAGADAPAQPFDCPQDADGISYICWVSAGKCRLTVTVPGYPARQVEANAPGTVDVPMK